MVWHCCKKEKQNFDLTQIKTATLRQLPQAPLPSAFRNAALAWSPHAPSSLETINVN